jgi:hypothetical protein
MMQLFFLHLLLQAVIAPARRHYESGYVTAISRLRSSYAREHYEADVQPAAK